MAAIAEIYALICHVVSLWSSIATRILGRLSEELEPVMSNSSVSWLIFIGLSFFTLFLVPRTCRFLSHAGRARKVSVIESFVLLGMWVCWLITLRHACLSVKQEIMPFDPYSILGISPTANSTEVKKAYRQLSLRFHPDKVLASDMAPANYFVDHVSKAYASLTNPTAMAAFEKFGHPDGAENNLIRGQGKVVFTLGWQEIKPLLEYLFFSSGNWETRGKIIGALAMSGYVFLSTIRWLWNMKSRPRVTFILVAANIMIHYIVPRLPGGLQAWLSIPSQAKGCLSPFRIVQVGQWSRLIWSAFLHGDGQIISSMISLSVKGASLEPGYGHARFGMLFLELIFLSHGLMVGIAHILALLNGNTTVLYYHTCGLGLLPVLFGLKVVLILSTQQQNQISIRSMSNKALAWIELWFVTETTMFGCFCGIFAGAIHLYITGPFMSALLYHARAKLGMLTPADIKVRIVDGFMRHCQADAKWLALLRSLKTPTQEMIAGAIQVQAQWYAQNVDPLLDPTWFAPGPVNVQATTVDPSDESITSDPSTQLQPSMDGDHSAQQEYPPSQEGTVGVPDESPVTGPTTELRQRKGPTTKA